MLKIHRAVEAMSEEYTPCMWAVTDPEADVWQAKLDAKLKKMWGDKFMPFPQRCPHLVEANYECNADLDSDTLIPFERCLVCVGKWLMAEEEHHA